MDYYDGYDDAEAPELSAAEEEANYVATIIECAEQAPPLLMDELLIDAAIHARLERRAA